MSLDINTLTHPLDPSNRMDPYLYEYLDAIIVQQSSPEEAFRRFDDIANRHTDNLRKITKQVQECRQNNDETAVKKAVNEYDEALEKYIPVLMAQVLFMIMCEVTSQGFYFFLPEN